jgi:tRNA (guanine37-N1)-methyltransferase
MRLLDRDFDLNTEGETLAVPLVRSLQVTEFQLLQQEIGRTTIGEDQFELRKRSPRTLEDALSNKVSPEALQELPKSFDIVGDIAILELAPELRQYEKTVSQAILDVHTNVKAVFAKAGQISGSERVRPLRHLAGEDRTETIHREFGCSFKVDLSKVFFSPRLSTEHQRVAQQVVEGDRVVDMFAGVGPFSILIAKTVKNVTVDAIDSNPAAAVLIQENCRTNKVVSKVHVHLGDARKIVPQIGGATRAIMNHPSAAKGFVDTACDALQPAGGVIHYYTFAEGEDSQAAARRELEEAFKSAGHSIGRLLGVRRVREVAPMKWQIAIDAEVIREP